MHQRCKYYNRALSCGCELYLCGREVMKDIEDVMQDFKVSKVKVNNVRDTQMQKVVNSSYFGWKARSAGIQCPRMIAVSLVAYLLDSKEELETM